MINSKLLEIIRVLNPSEFHRLGLFLRSPFFQEQGIGTDELRLFELLEKQSPDFDNENLFKDKMFTDLYPGSAFVKGKLEKKMSSLLKNIERFLIQEVAMPEEDSFAGKLSLAKFYREKQITRLYEITLGHLNKIQNSIIRKGKEDLYNEFILQREVTYFRSLYNTRREDINLPATLQSLDTFYVAAKLEYSCALLSQNNFHIPMDIKDSFSILENMAAIVEGDHFLSIPLIKIYSLVFKIHKNIDDLETYQQLEQQLEEFQDQIPLDQLKDLQSFCRSFCVRLANRGNEVFLEKTYLLYKKHLEEGYLLQGGGLLAGNFRNIVSAGLWQKQFTWAKQFIEDFKDRIVGSDSPEEIYRFNLGHYYFELKDYDTALDHLVGNYKDMYYHIAAKRMEIKVYYEQKSVLLESKIDAFKIFIHRFSKKKLPETPRMGNNNFINAMKQILASTTRYDAKRITRLIEKVQQQEVIFEKRWLLEKLREIKV